MRRTALATGLLLLLTACSGESTSTEDDSSAGESASTANVPATDQPPDTGGDDICDVVAIDPDTFGAGIGREGLQTGESGPADDFFNLDGVVSCSYRYVDPAQTNRNDGFSVWAVPGSAASAQELADGVVSLNPGSLRAEALADDSGFIAVFSGELYLGMAGSDGDTSAYAQINPRLETPDLLVAVVDSALGGD